MKKIRIILPAYYPTIFNEKHLQPYQAPDLSLSLIFLLLNLYVPVFILRNIC